MANHLTLLLEILNDLESEKLDEFKLHLSKGALKGIEPIPRGRLQKALDASAIAGLMTELYIGENSLDIALHILREIKQIELAARLEQKWRNPVGQRSQLDASPSDKPNGYDAAAAAGSRQVNSESRTKYMIGDKHFIDEHRRWLIENISTVEPILDRLLSKKVITHENYTLIRSKSTSAQSMRELYALTSIRSTNKGKDSLYDALMELEPFVMEELKDAGVK